MRIVRDLEAAAFKAWKAIERQVSPDGKVAGGAGLHREKVDLLPRDEQALRHRIGADSIQPGAASADELACLEPLAALRGHRGQGAVLTLFLPDRRYRARQESHTLGAQFRSQRVDCPASHQRTARRFEE